MPRAVGAREADTYGQPTDARERRRRGLVTFGILLLLLFFAAWYALSYARAEDRQPEPSASPPATTACADPADVAVNVYNATSRDGLAAGVAEDLRARGFDVRTVANDPRGAEVTGVAQVRHGSAGQDGARSVAAHVTDAQQVRDGRKRATVDLVLGPRFTSLADGGEVASRGC